MDFGREEGQSVDLALVSVGIDYAEAGYSGGRRGVPAYVARRARAHLLKEKKLLNIPIYNGKNPTVGYRCH